jgi:adenylate cyclase
MVTPILDNRGVVNKFIGDAVMAVFSPVFGVSDHARAALEAGLGMRESLAAFNGLGRYEPIRHGVGVHTGILVAGTVGTDERREYTVIGDTVNVASRIESQTKVYEADLLASAETVAALSAKARDSYHFTATEPITLRGKSEPMVLYRVNAWD